ncbi:hypothetical protein [Bradyrhizobium guangdongense]
MLPILTSFILLCFVGQTPSADSSNPSSPLLEPSVEQIITGVLTSKLVRFRSQPGRSLKSIAGFLKQSHDLGEFQRLPSNDRARALLDAAEKCSDLRLSSRATELANEAALLADELNPQDRAPLLVDIAKRFADLGEIEQAYNAEDRAIEAIANAGYPPMTGADLRTLMALIAQRPDEEILAGRIKIGLAISQMRLRFHPPAEDVFRDVIDAATKSSDN